MNGSIILNSQTSLLESQQSVLEALQVILGDLESIWITLLAIILITGINAVITLKIYTELDKNGF